VNALRSLLAKLLAWSKPEELEPMELDNSVSPVPFPDDEAGVNEPLVEEGYFVWDDEQRLVKWCQLQDPERW